MIKNFVSRLPRRTAFRAAMDSWAARSALLAWALFAGVGLAVFDDYGAVGDESRQRALGIKTLDYVLERNDALLRDHNKAYGVAFEAPLALTERLLGLQDSRAVYLWRHLLTHLLFLAAGLGCARLTFRLYRSRLTALCALGLFLLHPRLYAHSFFNSKDIPFLSLFMLALGLIERACRRGTVAAFLLCGAGVGLLINVRPMGILLFFAVLALRACDCVYASDWTARRRILRTSGWFVLASVLAVYATWPYLWGDPVNRFVRSFARMADYYLEIYNLFKGDYVLSTAVPPDYVPTWFAITTPPLALGLGVLGAAAILRRVCNRPGSVLRNAPLRFECLLLACLALPVLAVILLRSTLYTDWRHMYFLYAPFCVAAAAGLRALVVAAGRRWPRGGTARAYGLAAAAVSATFVAMIQLHPHQHIYFNFWVDRATSGQLAQRYHMDPWAASARYALEHLLTRYPEAAMRVRMEGSADMGADVEMGRAILPAPDRQRILRDPARADFYVEMQPLPPRGLFAPSIFTLDAYRSPVFSVVALDPSWADAATAALYRAAYRAVTAGEPVARDRFDVYLDAHAVNLVQDPCRPEDTLPKFFLHVAPVNPRDLSAYPAAAFENRDFHFHHRGVRLDGKCLASVPLPTYPIRSVRVGQWIAREDRLLWRVNVPVPLAPRVLRVYRTAYRTLAARAPTRRAAFDVYVSDDAVAYVKEPCTAEDTQPKFLLHIVPVHARDLPADRRRAGFDNRDFQFDWQGAHFDGRCLAQASLPAYAIERVRVGQFRSGAEPLWREDIPVTR